MANREKRLPRCFAELKSLIFGETERQLEEYVAPTFVYQERSVQRIGVVKKRVPVWPELSTEARRQQMRAAEKVTEYYDLVETCRRFATLRKWHVQYIASLLGDLNHDFYSLVSWRRGLELDFHYEDPKEYLTQLVADLKATWKRVERLAEPAAEEETNRPGKPKDEKIAERDRIIRDICKRYDLKGRWAELRDRANDDDRIKALNLTAITVHVARDAVTGTRHKRGANRRP